MELHLHPTENTESSTIKPNPKLNQIHPTPVFQYHPSSDGEDTNLLILLHGLGDTHVPFAQLGKKLNLPQTAVLSLRAFERVPVIEEEGYQWWDSFHLDGSIITNPNPSATLNKLVEILEILTSEQGGWSADSIHLFGFAQGGSCVSELGLLWARSKPQSPQLGSIVSVSGPLLSLPTIPSANRSSSPILLWSRKGEDEKGGWRTGLDRGYRYVHQSISSRASPHHQQMPTNPQEWQPILQFWSKFLKSHHPWESNDPKVPQGPTYEVRPS